MKPRICRAISSPMPTRPTGNACCGLRQHVAPRRFRHRGADRRIDDAGRYRIDAHRRQFEGKRPCQQFQRAVGGADDRRIRPRTNAQETRDQRQRSAGADLRLLRDTPCAPELAFHRGADIFHRHRLERAGAQLRRRDHDMIDGAATPEQFCDAVVAGDVGGDRNRVQLLRGLVEPLDIAGRNDDVSAFALRHFRGRKTNARGATDDDDFLASKQHVVSLREIRRVDSACRCRPCFVRARAIPRRRRRLD